MNNNPTLERQILAAPEQPDAYLVYSDWLLARGDPRGELISTQHALLENPDSSELLAVEQSLLEAHRSSLFGADPGTSIRVQWHLGFWRGLVLGQFGWTPTPCTNEHVAEVLTRASARFLRSLAIDGPVTPEVLVLLANHRQTLSSVDVAARTDQPFDDASFAGLAALTELRHLHLFSCSSVTPVGMSVLRELTKLESLDLRNCRLTDAGVDCLLRSPLSNVSFNVVSTDFTAAGMSGLAELPLETLGLSSAHIGDEYVETLENHDSLRELSLADAPITARGGRSLGTLNLRRLNLGGSSLGDDGVAELPRGLLSLSLGHCGSLSDASCEAIASMPNLEYLDLSASNAISKNGLAALGRLPRLKTLILNFCQLSSADLEPLRGHPNLRDLGLAFNNLDDDGLRTLEALPALKTLDLASAPLTVASVDRLAAMPNLEYLGLYDCPRDALDHAESLESLDVYARDTLTFSDQG